MSSSEADDDFVTYGTPLEPLEEDEIPSKKPCLLEDQIVRDKQGKRRFHGAFTGGFSAGFFNTVGSLEGWKPSSFKSSKSEKQKILQQRPEDYMDEEDTGEFGIAPIVLKTKMDYQNNKANPVQFSSSGINLGAFIIHDLFKPISETVGTKLLAKMGWKQGQGIGPRAKKSEKNRLHKFRKKIYNVLEASSLEQADPDSESDSDSNFASLKYAPNDYEPFLLSPKTNFFGIGYQGLQKKIIFGSFSTKNYGENFSLHNPKKKHNVVGQGFGVGAFEDEDEDIYAKDDISQYDFSLTSDNCKSDETVKSTIKTEEILEGFKLQSKKCIRAVYQLPVIPKNFKGNHQPEISRFHNVEIRSNISEKDKESGKVLEEFMKKIHHKNKQQKEILPGKLSAGCSNFKPFSFDLDKQDRFEKYLQYIERGRKDDLNQLQPLNMTEWEKKREKVEFDQAEKLLTSLSKGLKNRFLPSSQSEDLTDPLAVVEKFSCENEDYRTAAKMKMFGVLTRKVQDWSPCQLLSKRFNIPPLIKRLDQKPKTEKKIESGCGFENQVPSPKEGKEENFGPTDHMKIQKESQLAEKVEQKQETQDTNVRKCKVDLFKAIFLASDDEEEKGKLQKTVINYEEKVINKERNTSPPRGIFENIKLKLADPEVDNDKDKMRTNTQQYSDTLNSNLHPDLVYGPKIPEKIEASKSRHFYADIADNCLWVEKNSCSKKHKKKDKKMKKSFKSKHKSKKKKSRK